MSNDKPECTGGPLRKGLLAWARKRQGYVIGGRELLRQMEKCGCIKCKMARSFETDDDNNARSE